MQVTFSSLDEEMNRIQYEASVKQEENYLIFEDKSVPNTWVKILIESEVIHLVRYGQVQMEMTFDPTKKTIGHYQNEMGLDFNFMIDCSKLSISKEHITIHYQMILDETIKTKHKISLLFH
ncbi:MAG: DUF1934 domain-containing protein [Anaeroplasmataceae bacterium]|nr:DUF1934 domain-containing protein [Anaeroplasmataceae bacterium]